MFILALIITVLIMLIDGLVISQLWNWFVAPTFGITTLSLVQSMGMALLLSYFKKDIFTEKKEEDTEEQYAFRILIQSALRPIVAVIFGLILTMFL